MLPGQVTASGEQAVAAAGKEENSTDGANKAGIRSTRTKKGDNGSLGQLRTNAGYKLGGHTQRNVNSIG
jgi:hypothetical protein